MRTKIRNAQLPFAFQFFGKIVQMWKGHLSQQKREEFSRLKTRRLTLHFAFLLEYIVPIQNAKILNR